ncbi:MAG: hypothetical protein JWM07_10 [Candidatus Saccharibacteria bacterium]|nr:hypothetical protein [Candidatus Saccharibacteria bacterium]
MTNKTSTPPQKAAASVATDQGNGLAISSLALGILSLAGMFFLTGIPAIITGIMSLRKGQKERGMSIAGIIMGSIGTLLSLLLLLALIFIVALGVMSNPQATPGEPSFDTELNMPIESSRT